MTEIPTILVIDDLFGRRHVDRRNEDRSNLCGQFLLQDITADEPYSAQRQSVVKPVARAHFCRGVRPASSTLGDFVVHDLDSVIQTVRNGYLRPVETGCRWATVLLDLCFYTGEVTERSQHQRGYGMPIGLPGDDSPSSYFGLEILDAIRTEFPNLPVIMLSSMKRKEVSLQFTTKGALAFISRENGTAEELRKLLWRHALIPDLSGSIVGQSEALLIALRNARRSSLHRENVLLTGERGTGKELLARYIGTVSDERTGPYNIVNSPSLTAELAPSILEGIIRGQATSVSENSGVVLQTNGGDLFLDEIKDLLPQVQAILLRILQSKTITPIGSTRAIPVDVRFLSATNANVEELTRDNKVRKDLIDRLRQGGEIELPSLAERKEDIPLLTLKFVREAEEMSGAGVARDIEPAAIEKLLSYSWPGNIRQLRECILSAVQNYGDLDYLIEDHLQLPVDASVVSELGQAPIATPAIDLGKVNRSKSVVSEAIDALDAIKARALKKEDLEGALVKLQSAYGDALIQLLAAALRHSSFKEDRTFYSNAIRLLTLTDMGDNRAEYSRIIERILRGKFSISKRIEYSVSNETLESLPELRAEYCRLIGTAQSDANDE